MIFHKKCRTAHKCGHSYWLLLAGLGLSAYSHAQRVSLTDLSFFEKPGANWRIAGDANAHPDSAGLLTTEPGTGVLVNQPAGHGEDLLTSLKHADADVEFDYLMAKGSNSGVYLQGRYEVQLLDSWGVLKPRYGDNGGIYQRWDDSRGAGNQGFEGYAPRTNTSYAPGLWQHLKISFKAPRFDASGKKIENARILKVELNGITIHENVELQGPTAGSMGAEVAAGPLRIQGDHGPVAIRNLGIVNYDKARPEITDLQYALYKGRFEAEPDFSELTPDSKGSLGVLSASSIDTKKQPRFLVRYTGKLNVAEAGEYKLGLNVEAGGGVVKIDGKPVGEISDRSGGTVALTAGSHALEVFYAKTEDWGRPGLGLSIAGPGIREYLASDASSVATEETDPILVDGVSTPVLRSFMDVKGAGRVTHAVSVAFPQQVYYTYDLDKGNIIQVWRGQFLDATPMWHDRGDGSSRPMGALRSFGAPAFALDVLKTPAQAWRTDSTASAYRPKGYALDENERPSFMYQVYGAKVKDAIKVLEHGFGFSREISVENAPANLYVRLAAASTITSLGNGLYLVGDKAYYIRTSATGASIRESAGGKELIAPIQTKVSYSIQF